MLGFDWIGFVFRADDIAYDRAEYAGHSILHLTHELLERYVGFHRPEAYVE